MPFDSDLSHDASLQQGEYLELWETTRFAQRQDPLAGDHVQVYHPVKDENGQNDVDLPRNHELGAERLAPVKVEPEEMDEPVENSEPVTEDRHLQGNEDSSDIRARGSPAWLSTAALRQPTQSLDDTENAGYGEAEKWRPETNATASLSHSTYTHWLPVQDTSMQASGSQHRPEEHGGKTYDQSELGNNRQQTRMVTELNLTAAHGRSPQPSPEPPCHSPTAASSSHPEEFNRVAWADRDTARQDPEWEETRKRCLVVSHPLYPDMLAKHAACLRVGTPVELLPDIEAQLLRAPEVTEKYRVLRDQITDVSPEEQEDLDRFMIEYPFVLSSFKELLQQHVYTDVTEAMMSCWEIEQDLFKLTGARPTQGYGATMSDDDDEDYDSDYGADHDQGMDCQDSGGFGPLVPSASERTLMEKVRKELKEELKQGYKSKIENVREEILRKRRAGKLPEGTTAILKGWWSAHSKWPYPTEEEKEILIQETGLELKQVNNWFINQRKRNWHSNPNMVPTGQAVDPKGKVRKR